MLKKVQMDASSETQYFSKFALISSSRMVAAANKAAIAFHTTIIKSKIIEMCL